jgi:lipopolysaccharide export system permease protein
VKKIHLLVLKSFAGPFLATFFVVVFVLLMQFLWKYIDDLAGKGLQIKVIFELLVYTAAGLIPMAVPLATLLSSIMAFGNMGENYELLAIKAAGISLQRTMVPLIVLTFLISISAFLFANYVLPFTNLKMRSLLFDVQQKRPELNIKEGVFYNGIDGYSIRIGERDYKTNLLKNLKIYDHTSGRGNLSVTVADSGYMKMTSDKRSLWITLYNGNSYDEIIDQKAPYKRNNTYPDRRDKFEKEEVTIDLPGFGLNRTDEVLFKSDYHMMDLKQLKHFDDSLSAGYQTERKGLFREISKTSYFKNTKQYFGYSKKAHPVQMPKTKLSFDSLFNKMSLEHKKPVVSFALSNAKAVKGRISADKLVSDNEISRIKKIEIEWHRKFTLSIACLIFFFIGAPLGAIIRKGGIGMPVVISVLFFVLYYVVSMIGEKFTRDAVWGTVQGMWASSFLLMPVGMFLTYKATTDSTIMNSETYLGYFNKIKAFLQRLIKIIKP